MHLIRLCLLSLCVIRAMGFGKDVPYLSGRVNDYAGMLSEQTIRTLEAALKAHEDSTSNQVAVLTIPGLKGEVLEEYSIKVAETWKLGQKGKDNGALLLVARDDRQVRIEVGRGLEGNLPDITCGRIIRHEIVPRFKNGDFDGGVSAGVNAILAAIAGAYVAEEDADDFGFWPRLAGMSIFGVVVGLFTIIALFSKGAQSWFLYIFLIPFWLLFPTVLLGLGAGLTLFTIYLIGFLIMKRWFKHNKSGRLAWNRWGTRFGSMTHSSSSGDGWSSSGGFSGGGGGFSGGGASGSW